MRERASSAWMIHILRSIQKEGMDIMFSQDKILVLWCRSHFPKWTLKVFRYNVNGFTFPYPIRRSSSVRLEGNHGMCLGRSRLHREASGWGARRRATSCGPRLASRVEGGLAAGLITCFPWNREDLVPDTFMAEWLGINYQVLRKSDFKWFLQCCQWENFSHDHHQP